MLSGNQASMAEKCRVSEDNYNKVPGFGRVASCMDWGMCEAPYKWFLAARDCYEP